MLLRFQTIALTAVILSTVATSASAQRARRNPDEDRIEVPGSLLGRHTLGTADVLRRDDLGIDPRFVCDVSFFIPRGINPAGMAAGDYVEGGVIRGFVRSPRGAVTTLDVPDATSLYVVWGINPAGIVSGTYLDQQEHAHGFLRTSKGEVTTVDVPGASDTYVSGISPQGSITGVFLNSQGTSQFIREANGKFTYFQVPATDGAESDVINSAGAVAGICVTPLQVHGFLRTPDGSITKFDAGPFETRVTAMNSEGTIAGAYTDQYYVSHGFVRSPEGVITTFDAPETDYTYPLGINNAGTVVGSAGGYGFIRSPGGEITTFQVPDDRFTNATAINSAGTIAGFAYDDEGCTVGYVRSKNGQFSMFDNNGPMSTSSQALVPAPERDINFSRSAVDSQGPAYRFTISVGPNPFRSQATIEYELPSDDHAVLAVYDARGARVVTLVDEQRSAGRHKATWSGTDDGGRKVPAGVYFVRVTAMKGNKIAKLTLVR